MIMQRVHDVGFGTLTQRAFSSSPNAWEAPVFDFFWVDRFSDGREQTYRDNGCAYVAEASTPVFTPTVYGKPLGDVQQAAELSRAACAVYGKT